MKLADYLETANVSAKALAKLCEVSPSTISRAADGSTIPSRELMARIYEATKGAVTPNDFFGLAA